MGGIAFSLKDPRGLYTPRMPPRVYRFMRDQCHALLRQRFLAVASPIEAPAKPGYGDVDIFVAWDTEQTPQEDFEDICQLLGTTHARVKELVMCDAQFAVPWPEGFDELDCTSPAEDRPRYCQIDLHVCKSIEHLNWNLWYYAHGDHISMIHNMMRPFDLTINTRGLFLRIPQIRDGAKKIFITDEPSRALRLLGYNPLAPIWETSFESVDELFQHSARCRLFRGFYGTELTGEDGRIMAVRETFRDWVAGFIPTCCEEYPGSQLSKDVLRREVFEEFPETKIDYEKAFLTARKRQRREITRRLIPNAIQPSHNVTPSWRNIAAQGLEKIIFQSDYSLGFAPTGRFWADNGLYNQEAVETFVTEVWEAVGDAAWQRHCEREGRCDISLTSGDAGRDFGRNASHVAASDSEPESDDDEDIIRFPPQPEGYRQTWWDSDANDI